MARYDERGCAIPTNLLDAAAWHYVVIATCRKCRAEGVFDPHALWNLFDEKGWDVGVRSAAYRLRCKRCGAGAFVSFPTVGRSLSIFRCRASTNGSK